MPARARGRAPAFRRSAQRAPGQDPPLLTVPRRSDRAGARLVLARGLVLAFVLVTAAIVAGAAGCQKASTSERPNVLWIVWDTVRADRLSLHGHARATTPFLARWSREARVFDNCSSVASTTVPAHASMFTNLMPHQHGASNVEPQLREEFETLPEIFQRHGWQTCLYSENPYISRESGFGQGFDTVFVPWDRNLQPRAAAILEEKIPPAFRNPRLGSRLRETGISQWALSAVGSLGETVVLDWLARRDFGRPFFVFLNYMEAHAPVIAPARFRERMMTPEQVRRSYVMNVTPLSIWMHTFGLAPYGPEELEIIGRTYDAALLELDTLLESLLTALEKQGLLDNTIVVVTSDHGEHLGLHHPLLDHQYSVYEPLLDVPLVLFYPPKVPPGRERRPVMNLDLHPTLLELARITTAPDSTSLSVSLLAPRAARPRFAAYLAVPPAPCAMVRPQVPAVVPAPYIRALRAVERNGRKLIYASDHQHELYDLRVDPHETENLISREPDLAAALTATLRRMLAPPGGRGPGPAEATTWSDQQKELLKSLGYTGTED